ncbi:hypothetical protein DVH05_001195 [Phytophthora capsici]|nr:hypothetical protein DVH05_001195 [Phytophthora capsici]
MRARSDDGTGSVRPPLPSDVAPVPRNNSPSTPPVTRERSHRGPRTARRPLVTTKSPMASTPSRRRSEALIATSHTFAMVVWNQWMRTRDLMKSYHRKMCPSNQQKMKVNMPRVSCIYDASYAASYAARCAAYYDLSEGEDAEDDALGGDLLVDKEDTLNDVGAEDGMAEYGAMESGDDAEQDDLEEGDASDEDCADIYQPVDDDDPEATETEIAAEVLFVERFLDSFGGWGSSFQLVI